MQFILQFPSNGESQLALIWDENSHSLVSAGISGKIHAWDVLENTCKHTVSGHSDAIMGLLNMPTIENFATAGMDTVVKLWDTNTFRLLKTLKGHTKGVQSLTYR